MSGDNTALMTSAQQAAIVEQVVLHGDLAKLSPQQRVNYYQAVCQSVGVNPLTKPFDYITLNGKLTLYATRTCTDQIRANTKMSISIVSRDVLDDIYVVTARGTMRDGRTDEATGAVNITGLKGEAKANAYMKAETKAKRRLTLSMVGLGILDEEELADTPDAQTVRVNVETGEIDSKPVALPKPEGPKAQHPLVATGFGARTVSDLAKWVGSGQPVNRWSEDQKHAMKDLTEALVHAAQAGLAIEELTDTMQGYMALDGAALDHIGACVAQLTSLRESFAAEQTPPGMVDAEVVEPEDMTDGIPY